MSKKSQKLTICLESEVKDFFGIFTLNVFLNGKKYTYELGSEYAVRKFKNLLRKGHTGKALQILRKFKLERSGD